MVSSLPSDSSECKKVGIPSNSSSIINYSRQSPKGLIIKDSHAEVLARRGLVASLWEEIEGDLHELQAGRRVREDDPRALLECKKSASAPEFGFRKDVISLHMYVSESPCGDATIYEIETAEGKTEVNFTGAKIILSGGEEHLTNITSLQEDSEIKVRLGREQVQLVKKLRVKSSRSNIPDKLRSMSLCCADKIVRWSVFGLQGALLSKFLIEPITLSSICVSRDPRSVKGGQLAALNRSLVERIDETLKAQKSKAPNRSLNALNVFIVDASFESSKTSHEDEKISVGKKRKIGLISETKCDNLKKKAACGMSLNWYRGPASSAEITVGATGLKRGKKAKELQDIPRLSSRLCRYNLWQSFARCNGIFAALSNDKWHTDVNRESYLRLKRRHGRYIDDSSFCGPLVNWIRSGKEDDFEISL